MVMKNILYLLASIVSMFACTEGELEGLWPNNSSSQPQDSSVTLESDVFSNFSEAGGNGSISFTASEAWTVEVINSRADSWISIHPTSGDAGKATITVTTEQNDTPDDRSATIIIKAGSAEQSINVSQKQKDALTVTASSFEVGAEGGEVVIEVKANIDFEYEIAESANEWVTYESTRALKTTTLLFTIAKNEDLEKREAKIYISSGELSEEITIYQVGGEPTIVLSQSDYVVSSAGETIAVMVASNIDVVVDLPADADWVTENATRGVSTNTFYFDITENIFNESRECAIVFQSVDGSISQAVKICQEPRDTPNQGILPILCNESVATKMFKEWDKGGEGVGYHDVSKRNGGTPDVEGAGNIGYTTSEEWLAYTVYVKDAGTYRFTVYGSCSASKGTYSGEYQWFHDDPYVEENALGPRFAMQSGGAWGGPWVPSESVEFDLEKGYHRIIFYMHKGIHNLYNFTAEWVNDSYQGTLPILCKESVATKMFKEWDKGGEGVGYHDVSKRNGGTPDVEGAGNIGYTTSEEWLAYTVYVKDAGTYRFTVYGSCSASKGTYSGEYQWFHDDPYVEENALGPRFAMQSGGAWGGPWVPSESVEFDLEKGYHRIIFYMHKGIHNLYNFTAEWAE